MKTGILTFWVGSNTVAALLQSLCRNYLFNFLKKSFSEHSFACQYSWRLKYPLYAGASNANQFKRSFTQKLSFLSWKTTSSGFSHYEIISAQYLFIIYGWLNCCAMILHKIYQTLITPNKKILENISIFIIYSFCVASSYQAKLLNTKFVSITISKVCHQERGNFWSEFLFSRVDFENK